MRRSVAFFLAALALFIVAWVGAATDEDFFNSADFFDATSPHHEHIVVFVAAMGCVMVALAVRALLLEIRRGPR